ncbi:MAG: DNA repair protein RadA [Flavobacteriaceae bacterium]|jgi:DNA repair protein RadA/Sms
MAKVKKAFFCQNCGTQFVKWQGQCSACKEWNTLVEEVLKTEKKAPWESSNSFSSAALPTPIADIDLEQMPRTHTPDAEFNRVLGGGLVPGAVILLGGEPGIGKSTLLLQLALQLQKKILYVSGEESPQQIKRRAQRLGVATEDCYILSETQTQTLFEQLKKLSPDCLIIDSIQTLHTLQIESSPGSVSQIRACTNELIRFAKATHTPVILVGHITKDGSLAGPKILEHMVDTVLLFEGDRNHLYRILRVQKNRFGATSEIGLYEMQADGLRAVSNPSELLISEKDGPLSGHAIGVIMEGLRPLLIEVQALVSSAVYGTPQRSSTGFNSKRLNMLLAVLEKRAGFALGAKDVFINVTGGLTIEDPATDLCVVAAILSSYHDLPLPEGICFAAEIGLSGEIRPVPKIEQRIFEAQKLGFQEIVVSKFSKSTPQDTTIKVLPFSNVKAVVEYLFG